MKLNELTGIWAGREAAIASYRREMAKMEASFREYLLADDGAGTKQSWPDRVTLTWSEKTGPQALSLVVEVQIRIKVADPKIPEKVAKVEFELRSYKNNEGDNTLNAIFEGDKGAVIVHKNLFNDRLFGLLVEKVRGQDPRPTAT